MRFALSIQARFLSGAAFGALALAIAGAATPGLADEPDTVVQNGAALHLPPPRLPEGVVSFDDPLAPPEIPPPALPDVAVTFDAPKIRPAIPPPDLPDVVVTFDAPKPDPTILPPDLPDVTVAFPPGAPVKAPPRPVSKTARRAPAPTPDIAPPVVVALPEPQKAPASAPTPLTLPPVAPPPPAVAAVPPTAAPAPAQPAPPAIAPISKDDLRLAAEALLRSELPQGVRAPQQAQQLRREREALVAFYAARDYAPIWIMDGKWTREAQSAAARLARAADDGLDLAAYVMPRLGGGAQPGAGQAAALAELRLSEAASAYARQASGSRVDPTRLSYLITARPSVPDVAHVLAALATSDDPGAALLGFNPPHQAYRNLRAKLHELRAPRGAASVQITPIPPGPPLRLGMHDLRVPLLRARFGLAEVGADPTLYDTQVVAAITDFQRANSLPANGVLTPRTIAALGGGEPVKLENEILANMERWRWMPRDMGADRIEVNIPDYMVSVFRNNGVIHRTRAVVGKPDTPTPVFSETMEYLIVNPSWNVPQSIIEKEMLPRLANDPDYLLRQGYEVIQKGDTLIVRQPPGERNALGRIKFMFPNQHAVYLHDTPSRALFGNEKRAYSHGCVRVDQPFKLAEVLLGRDSGWSEERVKSLVGGAERTVNLSKPLPIHIMYFTAVADESGNVQLKDDIYGYSRRVKGALGLEGETYVEAQRKPAHTAVKIKLPKREAKRRAAPIDLAPVAAIPAPAKPKSLFGWMFGQ